MRTILIVDDDRTIREGLSLMLHDIEPQARVLMAGTGAEALEAAVRSSGRIAPPGLGDLAFDPDHDLVFDYGPTLPGHANGLILRAYDERGNPYLTQTYYSVGGGFVVTAAELEAAKSGTLHAQKAAKGYPYPSVRPARCWTWARAPA